MFDWSDWIESQIEQALLWFLRLLLSLLMLLALARGSVQEALLFAVALVIHVALYLAAPRIRPASLRKYAVTFGDIVLAALLFYLTGNVAGLGAVVGFCTACIVAVRFSLWLALALNTVVWIVFTVPYFYMWLGLGESFPLPILSNLVAYAALTVVIGYAVSVEARQTRMVRDADRRQRLLATVHRVGSSITSTLEMDQVLDMVVVNAVEILNAEAGALLLLEDAGDGEASGALVFRVATGSVADTLIGRRIPVDAGIIGSVVRTGKAQFSNTPQDDANWSSALDELTGFDTHSIICVPLCGREQSIGALEVINKVDGTPFDAEDMELLSTFAAQACVAVENARLYEQVNRLYQQTDEALSQRLRELAAIREISQAIRASLNLEDTLKLILERVQDLVGYCSAEICLWDEARQVMITAVIAGDPRFGATVGGVHELEVGYTGWIARHQQELLVSDTSARKDVKPKIISEETPVRSYVGLPLRAGETFVGTLELASDQTGTYTQERAELLRVFADQAAVAIHNARLFEQTDERLRARVDEMVALQRTSKELNATLELAPILQVVLESAIETTGATHGCIMLMDLDSGDLTLRASQGYSDEEHDSIESKLLAPESDSIALRVLESGDACVVIDAREESGRVCVKSDTRSALVVPVFYAGIIVGLINLLHTEVGALGEEHLAFVEALSDQAAIAIGNALRFEDQVQANTALRSRNEQMNSLLAVSQKLRAGVPLEDTLEEVAYAIQETVGFDIVMISVVEAQEGDAPVLHRVAAAGLPLDQFEEAKRVRQPLARYERLLREEYRAGPCYFFPFDKRDDWGAELHTVVSMPDAHEWKEGEWHQHDMLLAPMMGAGGRLLGYISVDSPRDGRRPTHLTLESLAIFANQAAIALENTRLFEDSQRRADNLALINRVAQSLTQITEPSQVLDAVVKYASELLHCDMSAVLQPDPLDDGFCAVACSGAEQAAMDDLLASIGDSLIRKVAETGNPELVPATSRDARFVDSQLPVGSLVCVPIMAGRHVIGVLAAADRRQQALTRADQVLLSTLADQAAVTLESTRLFADTQQAAVRLSLLNEIGRRAAAQLDLQDMLTMAVNALHRNMGYFRVAAFLLDEVRQALTVAAANDDFWLIIPPDYRLNVGEGLVGCAAAAGETILANDAFADERFVPLEDWGAPASLSVPIKIADKVIGVLHAEADRRGAFAEEDAAALEVAADQLAVAIQNAQLFNAIQRQAEQLDALREVSQDLISLRNLDVLLNQIADRAIQLLGGEAGGIYLYRPEQDVLEWTVAIGEGVADIGTTLERGEGLSGKVWETGTLMMMDRYADGGSKTERSFELPAAVIAVPIQWGDEFLGVLNILASRGRGPFTGQDAELLTQFSVQAAIAIQNAHLFQETERRVAELATVNQIARAISSALDQQHLCELIYNHVSILLDTRDFLVALYDADRGQLSVEFSVEDGQPQPPVKRELGQGLISYVLTTGQPVLIVKGAEPFAQERNLTVEGVPAKSWLGMPMIAEDRVIGAIAVQSYEREGAFDQGHVELMAIIAGQAAVAFQNASLFSEREQRIGELAVLNQMAQAISSTLKMDALLDLVYRQMSFLVDTTNFYIALYNEEKNEITFPYTVDPEQRENWTPCPGGTGLTGRIIETGQPLLLPTGVSGLYHEAGEESDAGFCRSWLGVPMIAADRVLGVIAVQSYDREYVYDEHDLGLLTTVAAQVAVAVRNAQLYEQIVAFTAELEDRVEERTRELELTARDLTIQRDRAETLYRITSELGTSLDLDRVLHRALQLFADTLHVQHGSVMLLDQESGFLNLRATLEPGRRLPREGLRTPLKEGVGLAGWVLENRSPALVPDLTVDERWVEIPDMTVDARSIVAVPLSLGGGDILGVLTLGHQQVDYFGQDHLQLVTAAASQVTVAVSNSDLYAFITDQAAQLGETLQAMKAEADKSRSMLESIADGVLVLDRNGRVLLVNPAAEELLGVSAMVLEGDHFRHMLGMGETAAHRDLAQGLYTELRRRLGATGEEAARLQAAAVRLKSGKRVLAANIAPLITTIGETPGLVAALRDVSREAEVERLKNEFISTVSHELRTPMTSIKGYTDLLFLGMAGGLTDAQRNFLQIIKSNADRLTALVNDILDISRIETGRLRLTIEPLDLHEILSQAITSFEEQYRDKGLELEWDESAKLPKVRGDAARVTQVLSNLIANAWQYTPSGGRVAISAHEVDTFLQVDVADTGIGIGPDDMPRVFDRFYRVDHPVVSEAEGTGLGLSIVKMFVEMLGGEIWVESELGVGSTFSFLLPLATDEQSEEIIEPDLIAAESSPVVTRRPKILIVESNRELALSLRRELESEGYQVLLAGSGEDALWLAQEEQPQLIALDIMLPDLDGFVVLERLRQHPGTIGIPAIVISGLSETEKGYALGAVDYVVKPFDEGKLLQSVRLALSPGDGSEDFDLLVVDDDPDILGLLEHALAYHGYQVRTASDGWEALTRVQESLPDLILLDLKMPRMDGYEVIRQLKAEESTRAIPIVVITASPVDKEKDKVHVLGLGASQYITKPLSIEMLVHEIRGLIEERRSE